MYYVLLEAVSYPTDLRSLLEIAYDFVPTWLKILISTLMFVLIVVTIFKQVQDSSTTIGSVIKWFKKIVKGTSDRSLPELLKDSIECKHITYRSMYDILFSYYNNKKSKELYELTFINHEYLFRCIPFLKDSNQHDLNLFRFPLLFQSRWCLSYNPSFQISMSLDTNFTRPHPENELVGIVKRYTNETHFFDFYKKEINSKVYKSVTYDLKKLADGANLELEFCVGDYVDYMNFNEVISKETRLIAYQKHHVYRKISISNNMFKARNKYPYKDLLNYLKFPCTIGVNVFTIIKASGKFYTLLQHRKTKELNPEQPNLYHVIPAGTFQPHPFDSNVQLLEQFSLAHTVLRELLEEVFNLDEFRYQDDITARQVIDAPIELTHKTTHDKKTMLLNELIEIDITDKSLNTGSYQIIPTSYHIDLLPLKPQISCVFYTESDALYDVLDNYIIGSDFEGKAIIYELDSDFFKNQIKDLLNIEKFTTTGAIALAEGYYYYLTHLVCKNK